MRNLAFEEIMGATRGAVRFERRDGYLHFHRFTPDEYTRYTPHDPEGLKKKMPSTSCVHIVFYTDSDRLFLKAHLSQASSRFFGDAIDLLVDGRLYRSFGHDGKAQSDIELTVGLPFGEKKIALVLPGLFSASIAALGIAEDATFISFFPKKKMLIYGDSITQGYDAKTPSKSYANQLALALDAHAVCKAIGGEVYYPHLAELDTGVAAPDMITVAYGVNDWHFGVSSEKEFCENARAFLSSLHERYPDARLFVLSPLWCGDADRADPFPFRKIPEILAEAISGIEGARVVDCFDFIPHDPAFFADGGLHPNDGGYDYYYKGLAEAGLLS